MRGGELSLNQAFRKFAVAGVVLLFSVVSFSCSESDETSTPVARPVPSEETIQVTRGGNLRISVDGRGGDRDPHDTVSPSLLSWGAGLAYSRLFRLKFDDTVPLSSRFTECDLCESWEQVDATTFDITIRDDAFWQNIPPLNGRPLTAEDVVMSLNRQRGGKKTAPLLQNIESIEAIDGRIVRITLQLPDAEIFEKLAHAGSSIVPKELDQISEGFEEGVIAGSGPWTVTEGFNSITSAEPNPLYYSYNKPYLGQLFIQFNEDPFARASSVRIGIVDAAVTSAAEAKSAREVAGISGTTFERSDEGIEFALNTTRAPLDSIAVREAVLLAIDTDGITSEVWVEDAMAGAQLRSVSSNLAPPDPSWINSGLAKQAFGNRQAALEGLGGTGLAATNVLTLRVGDYGDEYINYAQSIAESVSNIGIAMQIERVTTRTFVNDVWLEGDYDAFLGASPPIAGLTARLFAVHHSTGQANSTGYSTPKLDRLIEEQAREYDQEKRAQLFREIEELIIQGKHRFNLAATLRHWIWNECVKNFRPNETFGNSGFLTSVWLDGCG